MGILKLEIFFLLNLPVGCEKTGSFEVMVYRRDDGEKTLLRASLKRLPVMQ